MRFRAEVSSLSTILRVCQSIEKLSKRCILKLTKDRIHFICIGEDVAGIQVWAQFESEMLFKTMRVESNANNVIHLEIYADALQRALRSAEGASEVIIRLAKKGRLPILAVSIKSATNSGRQLDIVQDVAVKVLSNIDDIKEPMCPDPDLHIVLPPLATVQTILSRLSKISSTIYISANLSGHMRLRAESDLANVQTEWSDLKHPNLQESSSTPASSAANRERDPAQYYEVALDAKSLNKFLTSKVIASTAIASVCDGFCCVFYVYIGTGPESGGVLTYFVPSVRRNGDE